MTAETATTLYDLPALNREIYVCEQTQSWSPSSIRTSWVGSLEAIRDASRADELAAAIASADEEARRLATIVARRLVSADKIRERLYDATSAEQDDEIRDMTIAQLVAWMRANDMTIRDDMNGNRDGWIITDARAVAYASCRTWRDDGDCDFVEIDLLAEGAR